MAAVSKRAFLLWAGSFICLPLSLLLDPILLAGGGWRDWLSRQFSVHKALNFFLGCRVSGYGYFAPAGVVTGA